MCNSSLCLALGCQGLQLSIILLAGTAAVRCSTSVVAMLSSEVACLHRAVMLTYVQGVSARPCLGLKQLVCRKASLHSTESSQT